MNVVELMVSPVHACHRNDMAARAAQTMWDRECGALPVLDDQGDAIAMVTDRDLCMAAFIQGKALADIPVMSAASHRLVSVRPDDDVGFALDLMRSHRVRRLPVVDTGRNLIGIVSLVDFARAGGLAERSVPRELGLMAAALVDICQPHCRT